MKIIFHILIIILIFIQNPVFAKEQTPLNAPEEKTIWDYKRDDFIERTLAGEDSLFAQQRQKEIDKELEKNLNVILVPISLEKCLKIAVANNYNIKQKKAVERQNLWEEANAYSRILPNLQYSYTSEWLSGTYLVGGIVPDDVSENPLSSFMTLDWSAFERGKVIFDIVQRKYLHQSAEALLNFSRDETILNTAISYYELLQKKAELDIYTTNVVDRQAQLNLTTARYHAGVGTRFDIYRAEAELAKAKQEFITAFNAIRVAQAKLANYMGIDVTVPVYPEEISIVKKQLLDEEPEHLINKSKTSRQDLIAERKQIDAMKTERNAIFTEFVPDVKFTYVHARYGTKRVGTFPSDTFSINVVAPLGKNLGVNTLTQVKSANYKIEAEKLNLVQHSRDIEESIINSTQKAKSASERIDASKKEVFASDKSLESSIVLMNVGEQTFIDVLQAQSLKVNAQVGLTQNITDFNISQVQILFDAGIISIDGVLNGINQSP